MNEIKPVNCLVKHETALSSLKNDCHPILAEFGNDQFSIPINDERENITIEPINSFYFEAVEPFQSQYKKPIKRNYETLVQ